MTTKPPLPVSLDSSKDQDNYWYSRVKIYLNGELSTDYWQYVNTLEGVGIKMVAHDWNKTENVFGKFHFEPDEEKE